MRYVSLDIETTGLDPSKDQILQIAMVVEDTAARVHSQDSDKMVLPSIASLPQFVRVIKHNEIHGNAFALGMNAWLLDIIAGKTFSPYIRATLEGMVAEAQIWLEEQFPGGGRVTVAGKNVAGFDIPFLPPALRNNFRHRVIDPGSVFVDWNKETLPSLGDLLGREVKHDALEDARAVIEVLRRSYINGL